jgi:hypothetical protein
LVTKGETQGLRCDVTIVTIGDVTMLTIGNPIQGQSSLPTKHPSQRDKTLNVKLACTNLKWEIELVEGPQNNKGNFC